MSTRKLISNAQRDLIERLLVERVVPESNVANMRRMLDADDPAEVGLHMQFASECISWMLKQPMAQGSRDVGENGDAQGSRDGDGRPACKPGVFETEAGIFVVKLTRDKERTYAKKLVELRDAQGDRLTEADEHVRFDFEYAPGAVYTLTEDDRMPIERAKELTVRYGRCINCGRTLKVAESLERGLGPVCVKAFRGSVALPAGAVGSGGE